MSRPDLDAPLAVALALTQETGDTAAAQRALDAAGLAERRFNGHCYSRIYRDRWVVDGEVLAWEEAVAAMARR